MTNKLKILFLTLVALIIMVLSVNAKDYGISYFNGGYADGGLTLIKPDGEECLKFTPSSTSTYNTAKINVNPNARIAEKTILSFDVCPVQTHQYMFIQILGKGHITVAELIFSQDGKMAYRSSPAWESTHKFPDGNDKYAGYNIVDIAPNNWYHINIIFDSTNGTTTYFLDGEIWGTGGKYDKSVPLDGPYITGRGGAGYNDEPTGNEAFYFDNITCYLLDKETMDASLTNVDYETKTVNLVLSEPVSDGDKIDEIWIKNTTDGENIIIENIECENKNIKIKYSGELESSTEYAVNFPSGIEGKFGGVSKEKIFYFQTPVGEGGGDPVFTNALNDTFDDELSTFSWQPQWCPNLVYTNEDGRGKVIGIKYANKPAGTETNINFSGFEEYFSDDSDIKQLSFDIKAAYLRNLSISLVSSSWEYPLSLYTSEKGWFWGADQVPAQSGGVLNTNIFPSTRETLEGSGYTGFADMNSNVWYNITFEYDSENEQMRVYVDNVLLKEVPCSVAMFGRINRLLIRNCSTENNNSINILYIDNFIIRNGSVPRDNKVKGTRFVTSDGKIIGPLDEVSRDLCKVEISFYNEIDENTLTEENVKLFYGDTEVEYSVLDFDGYTYIIKPLTLPMAGQAIKVRVSGVVDVKNQPVTEYATMCYADSAEGELKIYNFDIVNLSGEAFDDKSNEGYVTAEIFNTSDETKRIIVSLTGYDREEMIHFDYRMFTLSPGDAITFDESGTYEKLEITGIEKYTEIQANVLNGSELHYPIIEPKEIALVKFEDYDITSSENVRILGRGSVDDKGARTFNWPNSGIEFEFTGTSAAVNVTDITYGNAGGYEGNYFNVSVDGGEPERIRLYEGKNIICEGLKADETHLVKMVRSSEAYRGTVRIDKLLTDAEPVATEEKTKQILFIGDSYTAGYGNVPELSDCTWGCAQNTDNWYSYAGYTMRHFDADGTVLAYQGKGLRINNNNTTANNMMSQFENADIYVDDSGFLGNINTYVQSTEKWTFAETEPQLIVIWLGTNDYLGDGGNSKTQFKTAYIEFLENIKEKYPNATIICCSRPESGQYYSDEVEEVVEQIGGEDEDVYYLKINSFSGTGIYGHPNKTEHQTIANELIGKINQILNIWI